MPSTLNPNDEISLVVNKDDDLVKVRFQGPWRGRVEYNKDPLQKGRIKVRVWEIHGPEYEEVRQSLGEGVHGPLAPWQIGARGTAIRALPWVRPIVPIMGGGGGWDTGSFSIPQVGTNVYIMFENGNPQTPVYFGTTYDLTDEERRFGKVYSEWERKDLPIQPPSMDDFMRGPGPQMPLESQMMKDHDPTVHIIFKTIKGASLICDDTDAREILQIIDRGGQGLQFQCYVTEEDNLHNAEQRGLRSVFRGDQIDRDKLVGKEATVILADIINQGLLLNAREGEERVKLISNDKTGSTAIEAGRNKQEIELAAGQARSHWKGVENGKVKTEIRQDTDRGTIDIKSDRKITIRSDQGIIDVSKKGLRIQGDVLLVGNLNVVGNLRVLGITTTIGPITAVGGCYGCVGIPGFF